MEKIIEGCTFDDTLQADADEYASDMRKYYENYAAAYNADLESFLYYFYGITLEYFEASLPDAALYNVKCERMLNAVAEVENIQVSDEEYDTYVQNLMTNYGFETREAVEEAYTKDTIVASIKSERAQDIIFNSAVAK